MQDTPPRAWKRGAVKHCGHVHAVTRIESQIPDPISQPKTPCKNKRQVRSST